MQKLLGLKSLRLNRSLCFVLIASMGLFFETASADDAKVLPKNRWRIQLMSSYSFTDSKFDSSGKSIAMGDAYKVSLTPSFVSVLKPQVKAISAAMNAEKPGLADSMAISELTADIKSSILANAVAAEYGLTDRLSVGIILPIVHAIVTAKGHSSSSPQFEGFVKSLTPEQGRLKAALNQVKSELSLPAINQALEQDLGYDGGIQSWSGTGIGDLEIGGKFKYFESHPFRMTVKAGVRAPTGRRDQPDQLFDLAFGDGQWDLAAFHYVDYSPHSKVYFTLESGYTAQLPHTATYRVPIITGVEITPIKAKLDQDPGDIVEAALEANWSFTRLLTLSPKYRFREKFSDHYSGGNGIPTKFLSADSDERLHEGILTLGFSNLPRVRSGESSLPLDAQVFIRHRFGGKNVNEIETGGIQLKAYF